MTQLRGGISQQANESNRAAGLLMRKWLEVVYIVTGMCVLLSSFAHAGGISFDAGLTPAQDRWILRTQVRYMPRGNDPSPMNREMNMYMFPVVLAYGFRPDLTFMVRQAGLSQEMIMGGNTDKSSGAGDLFVLAKYRAYRINTPGYTLGIAPTLGIELPTGKNSLSSETFDVNTGMFVSLRSGLLAVDSNITYMLNGLAGDGKNSVEPGNELSLNAACAYQFVIGEKARSSVAPVLEINYKHIMADHLDGQNLLNTGESVIYISPGIKYTMSTLILEALVQVPAWQDQKGSQTERDIGIISGIRYLF